jgi:hypothetical protein
VRLTAIAIILVVAAIPGCGTACPSTWGAAKNPEFLDTLPDRYVVADAVVARYVPSPDLSARGYDLDVRESLEGGDETLLFLRVEAPIAGVSGGDRVLVIARREEGSRLTIVPGICPPLRRLPGS